MTTTDQDTQPREREEPVAIADALGTPKDLAAYIADHDAARRARPGEFFPLGVCRHCGASLGDKPEDKVMAMRAFGFLPNVCCAACVRKKKDEWEAEQRAAYEAQFLNIIPAEFVRWDDARGNNVAKGRAFKLFGFGAKKGMVIYGSSGSCKTRILWQLVRLIVEENQKLDNERAYTWLVCDAYEMATKGIPKEAERVAFLFIDDLGNESGEGQRKFETGLLHLLRKRCDWHRPTFVTTQLTGAAFKDRFFQGAAALAILRRFRDASHMIDSDNLSVAGMGSARSVAESGVAA